MFKIGYKQVGNTQEHISLFISIKTSDEKPATYMSFKVKPVSSMCLPRKGSILLA